MRVFISSLITGFEAERAAAREAIETLGHEPVMAEDFQSQANSPQVACLKAVRSSDLVLLVLVERYGWVDESSGVSPTHEEFLEARDTKPILVFVKDGVEFEPRQKAFVEEVGGWSDGSFYTKFRTPDELRRKATRALHDQALAGAVAPLDEDALVERLVRLFPPDDRNTMGTVSLDVGIVSGPIQRLLRPAEVEAAPLAEALEQKALFGPIAIFDRSEGTQSAMDGDDLVVSQSADVSVRLTEEGAIHIRLPLRSGGDPFQMHRPMDGMVVIEEDVIDRSKIALAYAAWLLDHVDPTQRVTHVAVGTRIANATHQMWRTRAEHEASPNAMQVAMPGEGDARPIYVVRQRAVLKMAVADLADDLTVPMRRRFKRG